MNMTMNFSLRTIVYTGCDQEDHDDDDDGRFKEEYKSINTQIIKNKIDC